MIPVGAEGKTSQKSNVELSALAIDKALFLLMQVQASWIALNCLRSLHLFRNFNSTTTITFSKVDSMAHHSLRYFILACFVIIIFLFILAFLDTLVDERKILATPTISKKKAVFTALASTKINARAQDVFNVLLDFKRYGKWNTHTIYEWNSVTADGSPLVGTKGKVKVIESSFINLVGLIILFLQGHRWRQDDYNLVPF